MSQIDNPLAVEYRTSERRFPSEYIERLVTLLVHALNIIERKRTFNTADITDLINKLSNYSKENIAKRCRSELIGLYEQETGKRYQATSI